MPPAQLRASTKIVRQIDKPDGRGLHRVLHKTKHMLNANAYLQLHSISLLLPAGQGMIAIPPVTNTSGS